MLESKRGTEEKQPFLEQRLPAHDLAGGQQSRRETDPKEDDAIHQEGKRLFVSVRFTQNDVSSESQG